MTLNEQYEREAAAQDAALEAIGEAYEKHIWEGWCVCDFIDALKPKLDLIMTGRSTYKPFTSKKDLRKWCADHQPYYGKPIPEVVKYFEVYYKKLLRRRSKR